jgi:hypothetical protein
MSLDRETKRYADNLDRERRRRRFAGSLLFLRFTGAHEYEVALEVQAGWLAETKKRREQNAGQGKPSYLSIEVAALPGNALTPLLKEEWRPAVGGIVYVLDKDYLDPPVAAPLVWFLQAYRTADTYPPAP